MIVSPSSCATFSERWLKYSGTTLLLSSIDPLPDDFGFWELLTGFLKSCGRILLYRWRSKLASRLVNVVSDWCQIVNHPCIPDIHLILHDVLKPTFIVTYTHIIGFNLLRLWEEYLHFYWWGTLADMFFPWHLFEFSYKFNAGLIDFELRPYSNFLERFYDTFLQMPVW